MDTLKLRKKDFLKKNLLNELCLEEPMLKFQFKSKKICIIPSINSSSTIILDLYSSALKQIEPLPRCIFLYRVFENYFSIHSNHRKPIDALIELYEKTKNHKFIPVFFYSGHTFCNDKFIPGKNKLFNLITKLKKEANKIEKVWRSKEWDDLAEDNIGGIIYVTGRNASAHAKNSEDFSKYDYSESYLHINDVNIFLELIARYIVEILNPNLKRAVISEKKEYEVNSYHIIPILNQ